jgi:hypothetical protein
MSQPARRPGRAAQRQAAAPAIVEPPRGWHYLNRESLPRDLRASGPVVVATLSAALFFTVFAVIYVAQILL